MRLVSLQLAPYGSLPDLTLELAPGVTVVHGPNEAGKSTVLSAYSDLLCGISRQTPMAFRAPRRDLRIHATLTLDDGTAVSVTRSPQNSPRDLLDAATSEPVGTALRAALVTGLDDQLLGTRFGLDHTRLVDGGRALVAGGGDLADIVFEARAGANVRRLVDALQGRAEDLYKPRKNSSSRLGDALRKREELGRRLEESMATAEAVETAARLRELAEGRLDDVRLQLAGARAELARLEQLAGSWQFWEQYQALSRDLDDLQAEGPRLSAAQLLTVTKAQGRLAEIDEATGSARSRATAAEADRRALRVDEDLMTQQPAVDTLVSTQPGADDARTRIGQLRADFADQQRMLREVLIDLGVPPGDDPVAALAKVRVPTDRAADLEALAAEGDRLSAGADSARAALGRADDQLAAAERDDERALAHDDGAAEMDIAALVDARDLRERLWQHLRRTWLHGETPPQEVAAGPTELAGRYEDSVVAADREADQVLAEAGRLSEQQRAAIAAAATAAATISERRRARAKAEDDLAGAERLLAQWQADWTAATAAAALPAGTGVPGWRERAARLSEARAAREQLAELEAELDRHESTVAQWDAGVTALAGTLGPPPAAEHLLAWFAATRSAYDRSRSNRAAALVHLGAQTSAEEELARLTAERSGLEGDLDAVAAEHLVDRDGLHLLADRARRQAELAAARDVPASALRARHPGTDLDALATELADRDQARLDVAVATAGQVVTAAEEKVEAAQEEAIGRRATHEELASRRGADELLQELSQVTAEVHDLVEEWAVTRIMQHLLTGELRSYLEANVNPVLERAGRYLDRLTGGRYSRLRAEGDGATRSLSVVGADGEDYGTGALSEGTASQLYLALRLAGAVEVQRERRVAGLETLPLMLDDVLETFDDDRTGETLELLAEIGHDQQVVVFTHHAAVAETARQVQPSIGVVTLAAPDALVPAD